METATVDIPTCHPQLGTDYHDDHNHDVSTCARCLIAAGLATDVTRYHITPSGRLIG